MFEVKMILEIGTYKYHNTQCSVRTSQDCPQLFKQLGKISKWLDSDYRAPKGILLGGAGGMLAKEVFTF